MTNLTTFIAFLVVFSILVFFHEFGHFIAAKSVGIKVEEFALGYGPKLFGFYIGETFYALRVLPLGGFCKMAGEEMEPGSGEMAYEIEGVDPERLFMNKPVLARMFTVAAGPFLNFILAAILFVLVFHTAGVPTVVVHDVLQDWPAEEAGIRQNDEIIAINGKGPSFEEILMNINANAGNPIDVTILRDGKEMTIRAVPRYNPEVQGGQLGISLTYTYIKKGFLRALRTGIDFTISTSRTVLVGIWQMIAGRIKADVAGPVGLVQMVGTTAQYGILSLIFFTARLSVNLGLLNLFPIPILDGGWILFFAIEGLRGRPIDAQYRSFAQLVGIALLLLLMVFATYRDITRLSSL